MKGSDWTISRKGHTYDFNPLSFLGAIQLLLPLLDAIKIMKPVPCYRILSFWFSLASSPSLSSGRDFLPRNLVITLSNPCLLHSVHLLFMWRVRWYYNGCP